MLLLDAAMQQRRAYNEASLRTRADQLKCNPPPLPRIPKPNVSIILKKI